MDRSVPAPHANSPDRPHRRLAARRAWRPLAALAAVVAAIAVFVVVYLTQFNGSSAKPLQLSSNGKAGAVAASSTTGIWSISSGSVAGYRVREKLAFLPAQSDAVGRTSQLAGTMTLATRGNNVQVTAASFVANLRALKSDRSMRDQRIRSQGLDSNQYPTASFTLTKPITLPAAALIGQTVHLSATGRLTIHGTTRTVTIPLTGRLQNGLIEAVGSITFPFSEFGMQAPSIAGFVSVENHATMEFDLKLKHGASAKNAAEYKAITSLKPVAGQSGPGFGPPPGQNP